MTKRIVVEEFHVTVRVLDNLPQATTNSAIRTLRTKRFRSQLQQAIADVFRRHPSLKAAKFGLSR
jgi:hypothetical protein